MKSERFLQGVSSQGRMVGVNGMTVAFQIVFSLDMPAWLDATGLVSIQQWMVFTECLNFTATVDLN